MKYVVFEDKVTGALYPAIIPDHVSHSQVRIDNSTPVSAGFLNPKTCEPFGKSDSLKLKPAQDDKLILEGVMHNNSSLLNMVCAPIKFGADVHDLKKLFT